MAILVSAVVPNQTAEKYDGMLVHLADLIKAAPGFILHGSHPADGGWRVYEVWDTREHSDQFFAKFVVPNLPPGIHPKRSYQELHSLVTLDGAVAHNG